MYHVPAALDEIARAVSRNILFFLKCFRSEAPWALVATSRVQYLVSRTQSPGSYYSS